MLKKLEKGASILYKFLFCKVIRFQYLDYLGFYNKLSDEEYLKKRFRLSFGYDLDLRKPVTYNEKLQWLKLYDRKSIYSDLVDKAIVKEIVAQKLGSQFVIPTLGIWESFDEIDFDKLPNQFVLKCTHDSGGSVICKDKKRLNIYKTRQKINKYLKRNYYLTSREWPYKDVKPKIIAEQYMDSGLLNDLKDYKFFCFDGEPKMMFIASDRQSEDEETKFDFFDMEFNHLPFINGHPHSRKQVKCPPSFEMMKKLASVLSKDIPHVRVDFYDINGRVYFGEMTFSHWSGFVPFEPKEWDKIIGDWIKLPKD